MPGRKFTSSSNYRYGFNGKENDPEVVGTGEGTQDYGMRIYNPSLGKFLSVDPLSKDFPELTPYQFASNTPIESIDLDGAESLSNKLANEPSMEGKGLIIVENTARVIISSVITFGTAVGIPVINAVNRVAHGDIEEGSGYTKPVFKQAVYKLDDSWSIKPIEGAGGEYTDQPVTFEAGKEMMNSTVNVVLLPVSGGATTLIEKVGVSAAKTAAKTAVKKGLDAIEKKPEEKTIVTPTPPAQKKAETKPANTKKPDAPKPKSKSIKT